MKSFFGLCRLKKKGQYDEAIHLPRYMDKTGMRSILIEYLSIKSDSIGKYIKYTLPNFYRKQKNGLHDIKIRLPMELNNSKVKRIKLVPKYNATVIEVHYIYENNDSYEYQGNQTNLLSIDLGVNNLATCVFNMNPECNFIIDGKRLKSINWFYNKKRALLQSQKTSYKDKLTRRETNLIRRRNNKVKNYVDKAARIIVNKALINNVSDIYIGYNNDFKQTVLEKPKRKKKRINQNFCFIPLAKLRDRLIYLGSLYGIKVHIAEGSYTSVASFIDGDDIPVYGKDNQSAYVFSGRRIKRGLYRTQEGRLINADINGAYNILIKNVSKTEKTDSDIEVIRESLFVVRNMGLTSPGRYSII